MYIKSTLFSLILLPIVSSALPILPHPPIPIPPIMYLHSNQTQATNEDDGNVWIEEEKKGDEDDVWVNQNKGHKHS